MYGRPLAVIFLQMDIPRAEDRFRVPQIFEPLKQAAHFIQRPLPRAKGAEWK